MSDKPAASDLVVARIKGAIERGELKSGDRLPPERELAQHLGISRPSIRSGLQALAGMGILQIRQGSGTFITGGPPALDAGPLTFLAALHGFTREQMFEARVALEVLVVGFTAGRATSEQLMAISDETTGMFASLEDPGAFLVHEAGFHRAIAAGAGNPVLAALVEMVSSISDNTGQASRSAKELREAADEHRAIYQAIRARDEDRARKAMADHLRPRPAPAATELPRLEFDLDP